MATLLAMRPQLSKSTQRKDTLPTIREDECEDLEQEASKVQEKLNRTFGDLTGDVSPELAAPQLDRTKALQFLAPRLRSLAQSEAGSRIARCAIDVATSRDRATVLSAFQGSVMELCKSGPGHEILVLLIDCIPVFSLNFMICECIAHCEELALHRYGSNVIERLGWQMHGNCWESILLHFHPGQLSEFFMKLLEASPRLTRSPYGSRVLQTLSEYGGTSCRELLIRQISPEAAQLAMHRTASQVIRKLLELGDATGQQLLAAALLEAVRRNSVQVVNIACSRSGSAVLQQISAMEVPEAEELQSRLTEALPVLEKSRYGRRLVRA
eukprot:g6269.t1